jgi:hypothetical protein
MTILKFNNEINHELSRALLSPLDAWTKKVGYISFNYLCQESDIAESLLMAKEIMKDVEFIILDGAIDDYSMDFTEERLRIFQEENINAIVISGCVQYLISPKDKIFYYPHFWPRSQPHLQKQSDSISHPKKYLFSSLNGISRLHRIILADHMRNKSYLDRCCLTFNDISIPSRISIWKETNKWWLDNEFKDFRDKEMLSRIRNFLPWHHHEIEPYRWDDHENTNPAYRNSYVNIITETNVREIFFTEKTFKALGSGQFFISINSSGSVEMLKFFGFDVFDDIIDHDYDLIHDPYEKIAKISELLDHLVTLDWKKLWDKTEDRRRKNVETFFSHAYKRLTVPIDKFVEQQINNR